MTNTDMNGPHTRVGLEALLTPDNCVLMLIDHQPFQFAGLRSHDTQTIVNNVVGLARTKWLCILQWELQLLATPSEP